MTAILDKMLARRGTSRDELPRFSKTGKAMRRNGVPADAEFQRIDALPRRLDDDEAALDELVELLTEWLKTPHGTQRLWRDQARCIRDVHDYKGLVGGVRVSGGKALISMLIPTVVECARPLIFVPAKSIRSGKTEKAYREARQHWRVRDDLEFVAYETLQQDEYVDLLDKYKPGIVICDEGHKFRRDSTRSGRAEKYLEAHPEVPFIPLSGTLMAGHIVKDVAKLCDWALKERSPVPRTWKSQKDWADALEVKSGALGPRMQGGALEKWLEEGDEPGLTGLRRAYGRRYTQTPGVVVSSGDALGQTLSITCHVNAEHDKAVEDAFEMLREDPPKSPDGWILVDAPVVWSQAQQLELGFYYRANPRPPAEWTLARQTWAAYCRERIKVGDEVDSEKRVRRECANMGDDAPDAWLEWRDIGPTFELNVEPVWLSDRRLQQAAAWLKKHKGIVWTQFRAFGERLSHIAQIPFFSADACDADGNSIVEYPGGGAICSFAACSEDLNLQDRWHSNLIVAPPSSGQLWEQALARTHRYGQQADEVTVDVWIGCIENHNAILTAREKEAAVGVASTDAARKLLVAEWDDSYRLPYGKSRRWSKPK